MQEEVPEQQGCQNICGKWLKQDKDFFAAGMKNLVNRWDNSINVGEESRKNYIL